MNKFIVLLLAPLLLGCTKNKSELEKVILRNPEGLNLWNYYISLDEKPYEYIGYKFSFFSDNEFKVYYSKEVDEKGIDYADSYLHDDFSKREWFFDSKNQKLSFDIDSFIIERYNTDTIFMRGDGFEGRFMMVRMKDLEDYSK